MLQILKWLNILYFLKRLSSLKISYFRIPWLHVKTVIICIICHTSNTIDKENNDILYNTLWNLICNGNYICLPIMYNNFVVDVNYILNSLYKFLKFVKLLNSNTNRVMYFIITYVQFFSFFCIVWSAVFTRVSDCKHNDAST